MRYEDREAGCYEHHDVPLFVYDVGPTCRMAGIMEKFAYIRIRAALC